MTAVSGLRRIPRFRKPLRFLGLAGKRAACEMTDERTKTLTELEGENWGPPIHQSSLVETVHRLRQTPIGDFTIEDLRITIGQQVGTPWLVPIAIEHLVVDPLCEGDLYPGDLLNSVLRVDLSYWSRNPEARREIALVAQEALKRLDKSDEADVVREAIRDALAQFDRETSD